MTLENEPDDIELMEIDDEEVDDPEVEAVIAKIRMPRKLILKQLFPRI